MNRPIVCSIAGIDSTAGAGLFADIKTLEQHCVYGLGVCTGVAIQNNSTVNRITWISIEDIIVQLQLLKQEFSPYVFKLGMLPNAEYFNQILYYIQKQHPQAIVIWDPILKSSSGRTFMEITKQELEDCVKKVHLLTPNWHELAFFNPEVQTYAQELSQQCQVLLKGGHREDGQIGVDTFYSAGKSIDFYSNTNTFYPKRGTGCILSAAIAANVSKKIPIHDAIEKAKRYLETYANSSLTQLGYHHK